jgi:hypothetical protein
VANQLVWTGNLHWQVTGKSQDRRAFYLSLLLLDGYTLKSFPDPITAQGTSDPLSFRSLGFGRLGFWAVRVSYPHVARVLPSSTALSSEPASIRLNNISIRAVRVVHDPLYELPRQATVLHSQLILRAHFPSPLSS